MKVRITQENFQNEVIDSGEPILLDFWARWCGPCRMLAPVLDELEEEHEGLRIGKIDVDMWPDLAIQFGVDAIPMLVYFKNGKQQGKLVGLQPKEAIEALIK